MTFRILAVLFLAMFLVSCNRDESKFGKKDMFREWTKKAKQSASPAPAN